MCDAGLPADVLDSLQALPVSAPARRANGQLLTNLQPLPDK